MRGNKRIGLIALRLQFLPKVQNMRSTRRAAAPSIIASILLSSLIVILAAMNFSGYRTFMGLFYAVAFALLALGTWRLSRFAA